MWASVAGSMSSACLSMSEMTAEARWRSIFEIQATRLLADLKETDDGPIWEQDLYGRHAKYLGPVHGYAGNMIPLLRGWDWLTEEQRSRVVDAIPRTLSRYAWRSKHGATWGGNSCIRRSTAALPILPRGSRHGGDFCRLAVQTAGVGDPSRPGRAIDLGCRATRQRLQSLSWHWRQWLCVPQALSPNAGPHLARTRPGVRDDGDCTKPGGAQGVRPRPILALDWRRWPCALPVALPRSCRMLSYH